MLTSSLSLGPCSGICLRLCAPHRNTHAVERTVDPTHRPTAVLGLEALGRCEPLAARAYSPSCSSLFPRQSFDALCITLAHFNALTTACHGRRSPSSASCQEGRESRYQTGRSQFVQVLSPNSSRWEVRHGVGMRFKRQDTATMTDNNRSGASTARKSFRRSQ